MWTENEKAPVWEFLGWLLLITVICGVICYLLEPYSIAFADTGNLTIEYVVYAIIGMFISTPSPMISTFITLKRRKKSISVKDFFRLIIKNPANPKIKTVIITSAFCIAALCVAIIYGTPTGSPWYLLIVSMPVLMVVGGGSEEVGWRGFLQPTLEKRFPFPIAVIIVGALWFSWHLNLWLMPTSNHYNCSLIGFAINIAAWSFALAAIYKQTKSVLACVVYHAFVNAIGSVYNWNDLFCEFPNRGGVYVYYGLILVASIIMWILADMKKTDSVTASSA